MYHIRDQMILYLCWRENAMLWKNQAQCYSKIHIRRTFHLCWLVFVGGEGVGGSKWNQLCLHWSAV